MKFFWAILFLSVFPLSPSVAGPGNSKHRRNDEKNIIKPKIIMQFEENRNSRWYWEIAELASIDIGLRSYIRLCTTNENEYFLRPPGAATKEQIENVIKKIEEAAENNNVRIIIQHSGSTYKLNKVIVENNGPLDILKAM